MTATDTLDDLLAAYEKLAPTVAIGPISAFRRGVVAVRTALVERPIDVDGAIGEFGACRGWAIRWGEASFVWSSADLAEPPLVDTRPGAAELVDADGATLAVLDLGGRWRLTWSRACSDDDLTEEIRLEGLIERRSYLVAARFGLGVRMIDYDLVWIDDPLVGFGPKFKRFVGFSRSSHAEVDS